MVSIRDFYSFRQTICLETNDIHFLRILVENVSFFCSCSIWNEPVPRSNHISVKLKMKKWFYINVTTLFSITVGRLFCFVCICFEMKILFEKKNIEIIHCERRDYFLSGGQFVLLSNKFKYLIKTWFTCVILYEGD